MADSEHELTYFDPNGCSKGHKNVYRYKSTHTCLQCNREYAKKAREKRQSKMVVVTCKVPPEHAQTLKQVARQLGGTAV